MKKIYFLSLLFAICLLGCKPTAVSLEQVEAQTIACDSINVNYKVYGSGDYSLVFVHGFGCDLNAWSEQFPFFAEKAQCVFIDMPGFGKSDKPHTAYSLDLFAKAIKSVIDTLHIERPVLVGHSLGTPICRQVIFNYPELNARLCDVDGVYCDFPTDSLAYAEYMGQVDGFVESFRGEELSKTLEMFVGSLFTPITPEFVKEYASSIMCATPEHVAYSTMKELIDAKYWENNLITVPALVFCSKNSGIPENYEESLHKFYSNMEYVQNDTVGHFIMMEIPQQFNEWLWNFVQR